MCVIFYFLFVLIKPGFKGRMDIRDRWPGIKKNVSGYDGSSRYKKKIAPWSDSI